ALAHALDVGCSKGNMVETARILVFLLGSADHDALARLACTHQVNRSRATGVEPITRKIERRSLAVLQPQHIAIEILGALQIGGLDGEMLQRAEGHRCSPWTKVRSASPNYLGVDGFAAVRVRNLCSSNGSRGCR